MEDNKIESKEETKTEAPSAAAMPADGQRKNKTREGSGYLRQLYSTARSTASTTHSPLSSRTTFMVNFIPVDKVDASELQVRTHFDQQEIDGLAKSVAEHGVLQPILVVQNGDRYKVIAGERRLRASKQAGLDRIPARVMVNDDKATHEIALRENLDRVDLHPIEEGEGYHSLIESKAYDSHDAIAKAFMKPKSRITECIGFTRLPAKTKELLLEKNIKQRSLLRKLQNTPVEEHEQLLQLYTFAEESGEFQLGAANAGAKAAAGKPSADRVPKIDTPSYRYILNDKGISVPSFRWKTGDDVSRLRAYVDSIEAMVAEAKDLLSKFNS